MGESFGGVGGMHFNCAGIDKICDAAEAGGTGPPRSRISAACEDGGPTIGVRGLMDGCCSKDTGKRIQAGHRQKRREVLVIAPPFGCQKDRSTDEIRFYPEAAETVQTIYPLYLQDCGQREISYRLNALSRRTPSQLRGEQCGKAARTAGETGAVFESAPV